MSRQKSLSLVKNPSVSIACERDSTRARRVEGPRRGKTSSMARGSVDVPATSTTWSWVVVVSPVSSSVDWVVIS